MIYDSDKNSFLDRSEARTAIQDLMQQKYSKKFVVTDNILDKWFELADRN